MPPLLPIAEQASADLAVRVLADLGVDAVYTTAGGSTGVPVRARVAPARSIVARPAGAAGPVAGGGQATHAATRFSVLLKGAEAGAEPTHGVAGGGILRLRAGDRLAVPGAAVNLPETETVVLRISGEVRLTASGYWTAEAQP